jgi:hypothetical protein
MTSSPDSMTFSIMTKMEGDYAEGLDFTVRKVVILSDSVVTPSAVVPVVKKDTSYLVVHEVSSP